LAAIVADRGHALVQRLDLLARHVRGGPDLPQGVVGFLVGVDRATHHLVGGPQADQRFGRFLGLADDFVQAGGGLTMASAEVLGLARSFAHGGTVLLQHGGRLIPHAEDEIELVAVGHYRRRPLPACSARRSRSWPALVRSTSASSHSALASSKTRNTSIALFAWSITAPGCGM
jgi:hypothetical protein